MKKIIIGLLTIIMMASLVACEEQVSQETEKSEEHVDSDNGGKAKYKEKDGIVYLNDEELTIGKLLELVEGAESLRYSTYSYDGVDSYFDNDTKAFYSNIHIDRKKVGAVYDMLSQSYYNLNIYDSGVNIDGCHRQRYLYKSLFDYLTYDARHNDSASIVFELEGDYCKVTLTEPALDTGENLFKCFWINKKTNILDKMTAWTKESNTEEIPEIIVTSTDEFGLVDGEIYFPTTDFLGNTYKWYCTDLQDEFDAILEKGICVDKYDFWMTKEESDFASISTADFPAGFDIEKIKSVLLNNEYILSRYQPEIEVTVTEEDSKIRSILKMEGLQENYGDFNVWITDNVPENKMSIGIFFDNMPLYNTTQGNVWQVFNELFGEKGADVLAYYPLLTNESVVGVDEMYDMYLEIPGNPSVIVSRDMLYRTVSEVPYFYKGSFYLTIQK